MASDIKLDPPEHENWVLIEGNVVKATASDFILDAPARRTSGRRLRRAMVHDQNDGLTINFNNDYPGGVTINDIVALNSRKGISVTDIVEIHGSETVLLPGDGGSERKRLIVRGEILIEPTAYRTSTHAVNVTDTAQSRSRSELVSLQGLINDLQIEIARLRERVAELEKRG